MIDIDPRIVPAALRERAQWVTWRFEQRGGKGTKPTKVPWCVAADRRASTVDRRTWSTFEDALAACTSPDVEGIGFVFSVDDPFVGVDLDDAIRDDGLLEPWAEKIVNSLNSYTERSPSGRGLHVIVTGALPPGGRKRGRVEMYEVERYFTFTAAHFDGTPRSIEERTDILAAVHAEFIGRKRPQATVARSDSERADSSVLTLLFGERDGSKWRAAYAGRWEKLYSSQSEADLALARKLRFYTSGDKERTRRLLFASGLRREKWDEARGSSTYFEAFVIDPAFRAGGKVYAPREPHAKPVREPYSSIPRFVLERSSAAELRVYTALASFANSERTCFPSVSAVARVARISERRVQIALRRLETAQCITTHRRFNQSNRYALPMRAPEQCRDGIDARSESDEAQRGDVFITPLEEQRGDENARSLDDENSKGVTFSHQRGDVFVHPKQYQEELLTQGARETTAFSVDERACAPSARELLSDGRPRVLLPSEIGESDLLDYARAKYALTCGPHCGDCVHCGRDDCWYDRATETVGCVACDPMPKRAL